MKPRTAALYLLLGFSACSRGPEPSRYERAVAEESYRASYLQELFTEEKAEGRLPLEFVEGFFYDPDFKGLRSIALKEREKYPENTREFQFYTNVANKAVLENGYAHPATTMASVPIAGSGQPSKIFFSRYAFIPEAASSEDELLGIAGHEGLHCFILGKGFPEDPLDDATPEDYEKADERLKKAFMEVIAYSGQLGAIQGGKINVGDGYRRRVEQNYTRFYSILEEFKNEEGPSGRFARAAMRLLKNPMGKK